MMLDNPDSLVLSDPEISCPEHLLRSQIVSIMPKFIW